jgi:hypothetical protein
VGSTDDLNFKLHEPQRTLLGDLAGRS